MALIEIEALPLKKGDIVVAASDGPSASCRMRAIPVGSCFSGQRSTEGAERLYAKNHQGIIGLEIPPPFPHVGFLVSDYDRPALGGKFVPILCMGKDAHLDAIFFTSVLRLQKIWIANFNGNFRILKWRYLPYIRPI